MLHWSILITPTVRLKEPQDAVETYISSCSVHFGSELQVYSLCVQFAGVQTLLLHLCTSSTRIA